MQDQGPPNALSPPLPFARGLRGRCPACGGGRLFQEFLRLENGVPSHHTFSRIFRLLDPSAFAACFGRFLTDLGAAGAGVVAIDGKTLRRSFDAAADRSR